MRRAARVDANQAQIVQALSTAGASVTSLASVGNGVPDLLVGFRGVTLLIEVKDGAKRPSERKLTPEQVAWRDTWRGGPYAVVTDVGGALRAIGVVG